jgi:hypothetical protein
MPDATSGPEPTSADEFDRELRELTEGTAGKPLFFEPSAAERARSAQVLPAIRRGRGRVAIAVFLVILLAVGAVLLWAGYVRSSPNAGNSQPGNVGPATAVVQKYTGTISPIDFFAGPPADPFRRPTGSASADHWADGAAGIVPPAAAPVGGFTRAQVAAAYETTRKLLIAANLDKQTLLGGPPTAFASLLTAKQRAIFLAGLNKSGVDKYGSPLSTRAWVASFAPGSADLIGNVIKVHGTMSARAVTRSGTVVLAIEVNYLFAYAVEPPHEPTDWTRIVDHEYGTIDFAHWDGRAGALQPWDNATIGRAGAQCGTGDGYIHPDYPSDRSIDTAPSGPVINVYSLTPRSASTSCGRSTGT